MKTEEIMNETRKSQESLSVQLQRQSDKMVGCVDKVNQESVAMTRRIRGSREAFSSAFGDLMDGFNSLD